jgi:hypothetical protein
MRTCLNISDFLYFVNRFISPSLVFYHRRSYLLAALNVFWLFKVNFLFKNSKNKRRFVDSPKGFVKYKSRFTEKNYSKMNLTLGAKNFEPPLIPIILLSLYLHLYKGVLTFNRKISQRKPVKKAYHALSYL